jgi:hypothetical protein
VHLGQSFVLTSQRLVALSQRYNHDNRPCLAFPQYFSVSPELIADQKVPTAETSSAEESGTQLGSSWEAPESE